MQNASTVTKKNVRLPHDSYWYCAKGRVFFFLIAALIFSPFQQDVFAQIGEWTWMKGTASPFGSSGTWGTQGVADINNDPPAVYEACEWKDDEDNLWVFGGINNSAIIYYGTLWKYSITSNMWTWISGTGIPDQPGVYGTQGTSSPSNYPGARGWGELSWTDSSGNFWLFGGYGYDANGAIGTLGDLWKYDVITNEWTWMKGSNTVNYTGSFGLQGVADINNNPPARQETSCAWTDSNNNLWMFGGYATNGNANDLWKYEISTNTWTWMKGSNSGNQYGVYGTLGVSSPLNVPGGRAAYARWIDQDDNLWLYGGNGNGAAGNGFLEDFWKYTMSTNEWTWMGGSGLIFQLGSYGTKCEFSASNYPGNKYETRSCWVDECGYFFLYGGTSYNGHQGDLWVYNNLSNEWAWISGDNTTNTSAVPGTQGVSSPSNKPGLRTGADSWIDQSGNLWLFGGFVCSNDLWRFVPDYSCIGNDLCSQNSQTNFSVSDTTLCEKFCIDFTDQSTNDPLSWLWQFAGATPVSSTEQNPVNICYDTPGTYDVTLITSNANGSDTLTLINYITVYPTPPFPTITQNGNTLTSSVAASYQWQLNAVDISGATNQSYTIAQSGLYTVIVQDENGCQNSVTDNFFITGIEEVFSDVNVLIYPNPSNGKFIAEIIFTTIPDAVSVEIINLMGQTVFYRKEDFHDTDVKMEIEMNHYVPGMYLAEVKTGKKVLQQLIVFN